MSREFADEFNQRHLGWVRTLGLRLTRATADEVVGEWDLEEKHLQGHGIVHGGVHSSVIESLCSIGASISAMEHQRLAVGLENHTTFVRAARTGRLVARARPVTRGRRTQAWECDITDEDGRLIATGRVRLLCIEHGSALAGEAAGIKKEFG